MKYTLERKWTRTRRQSTTTITTTSNTTISLLTVLLSCCCLSWTFSLRHDITTETQLDLLVFIDDGLLRMRRFGSLDLGAFHRRSSTLSKISKIVVFVESKKRYQWRIFILYKTACSTHDGKGMAFTIFTQKTFLYVSHFLFLVAVGIRWQQPRYSQRDSSTASRPGTTLSIGALAGTLWSYSRSFKESRRSWSWSWSWIILQEHIHVHVGLAITHICSVSSTYQQCLFTDIVHSSSLLADAFTVFWLLFQPRLVLFCHETKGWQGINRKWPDDDSHWRRGGRSF